MTGALAVTGHLALGLFLGAGIVWLLQPKLLFYPHHQLVQTPSDWGMIYEDVTLSTDDGVRLHAWFVPASARRALAPRTVLFFHGNAGNISHRGDSIRIFNELGLDVFIIDYRGYGASTGSPSEQGLYGDAHAAWDWLTRERGVAPADIVLFGRSLGGAIALHLAARTDPAGLIVESSFDRIAALARTHYPLLSRFIPLRYRFAAIEDIASVGCPILVLHSPDDEIVPYRLGRRLFDAARPPKRFVELTGRHNDGFLRSQPRYQRALEAFLRSLPQAGDRP